MQGGNPAPIQAECKNVLSLGPREVVAVLLVSLEERLRPGALGIHVNRSVNQSRCSKPGCQGDIRHAPWRCRSRQIEQRCRVGWPEAREKGTLSDPANMERVDQIIVDLPRECAD